MRATGFLVFLSFVGVLVGVSNADPVLDQEASGGTNLTQRTFSSNWLAQTITVGESGHLVTVPLLLLKSSATPDTDLTLEVRDVVGDAPGPTVLGTATFSSASVLTASSFVPVNLPPPGVPAVAGDRLALVLSSVISTNVGVDGSISWAGSRPDTLYAGGWAFDSRDGTAWAPSLAAGTDQYDRHFRTFVEPLALRDPAVLDDAGVDIDVHLAADPVKKVRKKLEAARKQVDKAQQALDAEPVNYSKALAKLKKALKALRTAIKKGFDAAEGDDLRRRLTQFAAGLAGISIDAAIAGEGDVDRIQKAQGHAGDGDADQLAQELEDAVNDYKKAAKQAKKAL